VASIIEWDLVNWWDELVDDTFTIVYCYQAKNKETGEVIAEHFSSDSEETNPFNTPGYTATFNKLFPEWVLERAQ